MNYKPLAIIQAAILIMLCVLCVLIAALSLTAYDIGKESRSLEILTQCKNGEVVTINGTELHCGVISKELNLEAAQYRAVKNCTKLIKDGKMSDIKMSDLIGGQVSVYDECMLKANGCKIGSVLTKHAKYIANAINTHDTMQARIDELVFSLDDRDCYIADADMKNDDLQARIVELEGVIRKIHNIVGVQSEQGASWDDEVAFEHSEAVSKVFEISSEALKDKS
jgi:hypothetical protein